MRLRTEKGTKVAGNLLHVSSYRASNIIHTERWSIIGWTTRKMLPFYFSPILITSCSCRRDTRLSPRYIFAFRESLGMRLWDSHLTCVLRSEWLGVTSRFIFKGGVVHWLFMSMKWIWAPPLRLRDTVCAWRSTAHAHGWFSMDFELMPLVMSSIFLFFYQK